MIVDLVRIGENIVYVVVFDVFWLCVFEMFYDCWCLVVEVVYEYFAIVFLFFVFGEFVVFVRRYF